MRTLSTPGFLEQMQKFPMATTLMFTAQAALGGRGKEPSWVVGDPACKKVRKEDGGATLKIPAPFKFYCIRDDYETEEVCTFLLAEEY